jgi:hypothetical protein
MGAPREVPEHPVGVSAVEQLERCAVAGGQQFLVAVLLRTHASIYFGAQPSV